MQPVKYMCQTASMDATSRWDTARSLSTRLKGKGLKAEEIASILRVNLQPTSFMCPFWMMIL